MRIFVFLGCVTFTCVLLLDAQMICPKGFTPLGYGCRQCTNDRFKELPGNHTCMKCGEDSESRSRRGVECACVSGSFRRKRFTDNNTAKCYSLRPEGISFTCVTPSIVVAQWKEIRRDLDVKSVSYVIQCYDCPRGTITTRRNRAVFSDLTPGENYLVTLGVSIESEINVLLTVNKTFSANALHLPSYLAQSMALTLVIPLTALLLVVLMINRLFSRRKTPRYHLPQEEYFRIEDTSKTQRDSIAFAHKC